MESSTCSESEQSVAAPPITPASRSSRPSQIIADMRDASGSDAETTDDEIEITGQSFRQASHDDDDEEEEEGKEVQVVRSVSKPPPEPLHRPENGHSTSYRSSNGHNVVADRLVRTPGVANKRPLDVIDLTDERESKVAKPAYITSSASAPNLTRTASHQTTNSSGRQLVSPYQHLHQQYSQQHSHHPQPTRLSVRAQKSLEEEEWFYSNVFLKLSPFERSMAQQVITRLKTLRETYHQRAHRCHIQYENANNRIKGIKAAIAAEQQLQADGSYLELQLQSLSQTAKINWMQKSAIAEELARVQEDLSTLFKGVTRDYTGMRQKYDQRTYRSGMNDAVDNMSVEMARRPQPPSASSSSFRQVPSLFSRNASGVSSPSGSDRYYSDGLQDGGVSKEELEKLIDNVRGEDIPPQERTETPKELKITLLEHQKVGLTWLLKMERTVKGGILADDMGLGKTIQALSLIVANRATTGVKTTFIVAPVSLIRQWERELILKVKDDHRLSILVYHRSADKNLPTTFEQLAKYDVVITTYQSIFRQYKDHFGMKGKNGSSESTPNSSGREDRQKITPLFKGRWFRIILDEAQNIKNKHALTSKACAALDSTYRWCLSGTPMQNNIDELYSLLRFLRIPPYCEEKKFKEISIGLKSRQDHALKQVQALLKAVLLRRTKTSKIDGKPILSLPPKHIELNDNIFDADEESYYRQLETGAAMQMNKYLRANSVSKNYSNILTLLLRLRQACCHPALIERSEQRKSDAAKKERTTGAGLKLVRKLPDRVVQRVISEESFTCPICMDAIDQVEMVLLYPCGHGLCNECSSDFFMNNGGGGDGNTRCPTCRESVDEKEAIDYTIFTMVHVMGMTDVQILDQLKSQLRSAREEAKVRRQVLMKRRMEKYDTMMFADDFDNWPGKIKEDDNLSDLENETKEMSIVPVKNSTPPQADVKLDVNPLDIKPLIGATTTVGHGSGKDDEVDYQSIIEEFGLERLFPSGWVSSTKIDKCIELVETIRRDFPGEKIIIFSQFTTLLDLVEIPFVKKDLNYLRYDGSMTATERNDTIFSFFDKPEVSVLLISLKAGNVGLTLTCASHVIILDPFWNPFVEEQAMDRAHRIGQSRPVFVHRLLIKNTVEDRIMELQHKKKELISAALDESGMKSLGRLNQSELLYLFGLRPDGSRATGDDEIPV